MSMRLTTLLVLAAAGALLGCAALAGSSQGSGAAAAQPPGGTAALPELLQRLRAMEAASTCTASADCHALPVGARLCGGPSAWLAMSSAQMAAAAPLAQRYTALRKSANEAAEKEGMAATCQVVPQPAVGCVAGYCRTLPGGPSGRAD
ncbi:hypothetical protein [Pseudoduganella aquatica]|uniref:Uncharacterized protein n=1 Tax=Pseudoduganella aquatica TaxID=2660641 RepID=A0A7X4HCX7_9BURK|nr:hypothetical protein [Pseudoduganella aquatica]MYN08302.1 hypothetical protein [Pseudoduganella aquatica]